MYIKILTPERVVFEGEVDSIALPGVISEFHILKNHAPIVSSLTNGKVKLFTKEIANPNHAKFFTKDNDRYFSYEINTGGVIEFEENNGIILCDS